MTLVGQEQPRQAGRLVMRQDPWKANSGAKLRLGRPVPVSRSCLHQDELHLAKSPNADAASRDAAGGEDDLEPLAPAEEYVLGSPATSSSRQPGNSWEPTFKAKAPEGYRRWQPRAAGPTPTPSPQPASVGVRRRRWEWPTSGTASPARGGPLGPPLPGTLVYASAQDLPPAAAPPEDDEHSDAEAPSEANPPSSAEASGNEAPLEESSGDEEPEAPEESVSAVPASVAIKTDVQAVDEQAEKSEKDRSYTSEDVSAEMRPKKTSKEEAPDSDRAAADSAEPMAEKKSKKATSNKAKSASFLSDDESGSEAQTLAAPFAGGLLKGPAGSKAGRPS